MWVKIVTVLSLLFLLCKWKAKVFSRPARSLVSVLLYCMMYLSCLSTTYSRVSDAKTVLCLDIHSFHLFWNRRDRNAACVLMSQSCALCRITFADLHSWLLIGIVWLTNRVCMFLFLKYLVIDTCTSSCLMVACTASLFIEVVLVFLSREVICVFQ